MRLRIQPWLLVSVSIALGGCTAPAPPPPERDATAVDPNAFQGNAAWGHLAALAAIGPREMGTEGSARAREYIVGQLESFGLEVVEQLVTAERAGDESITLHNVAASVPGDSMDLLLILAPYDTRGFDSFENLGINDGGSGVAVILELARMIADQPLPYTTWFVFLEGEQEARGSSASTHAGSRALAELLRQRGVIEQVRLALLVNRVCDPDLHIARDLGSQRAYREEFFQTARRLGFEDEFDPYAGFEAPDEGQLPLSSAGLSRVVVLVDTSFGGDEPPGPYADTADDDLDHCAAGSLDKVGQVAFDGLVTISRRLQRIDRFAESPIAATEALRLEQLLETEGESPQDQPDAEGTPEPELEPEPESVPASESVPAPELELEAEAAPEAEIAPEAEASPEADGADTSSETGDRAAERKSESADAH